MKKLVSLLLALTLVCAIIVPGAYADKYDDILHNEDLVAGAKNLFGNSTTMSNDDVITLFACTLYEMYQRNSITYVQAKDVLRAIDNTDTRSAPNKIEYNFGQGTYVVGLDLQPGTYDITATSINDESSGDVNALGDIYSSMGLGDYGDIFGALSGLLESTENVSIEIINANGWTDKYLDLKLNETARIILEDGGKLGIDDGSVRLTFVR